VQPQVEQRWDPSAEGGREREIERGRERWWGIPPLQHEGDRFLLKGCSVDWPTSGGVPKRALYIVLRGRAHFPFVRGTPDQDTREMDLVLVTSSGDQLQ
jgi:hypothetical protein